MSRSGYNDDGDQWKTIMWRGAVASAIRGRRGQSFLIEMLNALDALPEKKLIAENLELDGAVCSIGAVGKARGIDMSGLDHHEGEQVAAAFGIAPTLAREIAYINDEWLGYKMTPEKRYAVVRQWIVEQLPSLGFPY